MVKVCLHLNTCTRGPVYQQAKTLQLSVSGHCSVAPRKSVLKVPSTPGSERAYLPTGLVAKGVGKTQTFMPTVTVTHLRVPRENTYLDLFYLSPV